MIPTQDAAAAAGHSLRCAKSSTELRARYGGERSSPRLEQSGDRPVYVLRWRMPDGEVRDFRVTPVR